MRLGVIARAEDRGLGIQTWETCRHLNPDRVLLIDPGRTKHPQNPDRFDPFDTTLVAWDGRALDEPSVRSWLDGLDAIYTAETFYDHRLPGWAATAGCAAVCHVNPEFFTPDNATLPGATWWAPTPWRLGHLPPGTRVVPFPVATDRFNPQPRTGPVRFLHVAGHPAIQDRNGTQLVADAAALMRQPAELTITTQHPKHRILRRPGPCKVTVQRRTAGNYWELYDGHDVLVMPRRYGGLCLPVQEAMAAGLTAVMPDVDPNQFWPGPRSPATVNSQVHTPAGPIDLADTDPAALAAILDHYAADPAQVEADQALARAWARDHSWDQLATLWRHELAAAPGARPADLKVSVLVPYRPDSVQRALAWDWVRDRYQRTQPTWEIVTGTCDGEWSKALAIDDAYRRSTGDILIVADSDVWTDGITDAVDHVKTGARWATPHGKVHRLTQNATRARLAGRDATETEEKPYKGRLGGGIVVLARHVWDAAPMDPRFIGWGHEDDAWALALGRTAGPAVRLSHDLWHLWHPPQDRPNRGTGSPASQALYRRYTRRPSLDTVIAEAREEIARERARRPGLHHQQAPARL